MTTAPVSRYGNHSSDGCTDDLWCVDGVHLRAMEEYVDGGYRWYVNRVGPCDGSCKPASRPFDLPARVAKMREERFYDGPPKIRKGKVVGFKTPPIRSTVELDEGAQALVDAGVPIPGRLLSRWYAKRDSEGETWCLGATHVRVATDFTWWSGGPKGTYKAHRVTTVPCDGSCAHARVELSDQMAAALDAALAERVA